MSERITQELRGVVTDGVPLSAFNGNVLEETLSVLRMDFEQHCDAIDAIHANLERENDRLKCELDRVLGELDDMHKTDGISDNSCGFMQNAEHHAWAPESHYVMLPKDADGVPIHIGDVMEWPTTGETFEVVGVGDGTLFYVEDGEERADWTGASTKRHHRHDTWEHIIEDALTMPFHGEADVTRLVARCKALAGDAE